MFDVFTKAMMQRDATSILTFLSVVKDIGPIIEQAFMDLKEDTKSVIRNFDDQNISSVDAITITGPFAWTSTFILKHFPHPPVVAISNVGPNSHLAKHLGNPENPSYQAEAIMPFIEPMSFMQRVVNTLIYSIFDYEVLGWIYFPLIMNMSDDFKRMAPGAFNRVDLLLLCSHFVTHSPQAYTANTVEVGGIHCR